MEGYRGQDLTFPSKEAFHLRSAATCWEHVHSLRRASKGPEGKKGPLWVTEGTPLSLVSPYLSCTQPSQLLPQDTLPEKQAFTMLPLPQHLQLHSLEVPSQACPDPCCPALSNFHPPIVVKTLLRPVNMTRPFPWTTY